MGATSSTQMQDDPVVRTCCNVENMASMPGGWRDLTQTEWAQHQGMLDDWIASILTDHDLSYQDVQIVRVSRQLVNGFNWCIVFEAPRNGPRYAIRVYQSFFKGGTAPDGEITGFTRCPNN